MLRAGWFQKSRTLGRMQMRLNIIHVGINGGWLQTRQLLRANETESEKKLIRATPTFPFSAAVPDNDGDEAVKVALGCKICMHTFTCSARGIRTSSSAELPTLHGAAWSNVTSHAIKHTFLCKKSSIFSTGTLHMFLTGLAGISTQFYQKLTRANWFSVNIHHLPLLMLFLSATSPNFV